MRALVFLLKLLLKIVMVPVILALTLFVWICVGIVYVSGLSGHGKIAPIHGKILPDHIADVTETSHQSRCPRRHKFREQPAEDFSL